MEVLVSVLSGIGLVGILSGKADGVRLAAVCLGFTFISCLLEVLL